MKKKQKDTEGETAWKNQVKWIKKDICQQMPECATAEAATQEYRLEKCEEEAKTTAKRTMAARRGRSSGDAAMDEYKWPEATELDFAGHSQISSISSIDYER